MADLFLILSDNPEAVRHVRSEVRQNLLRLAPGSIIDQIDGPSWSLITGRNPFVPYAAARDHTGAAVVIGSTYNPGGPKISDLRVPSFVERVQALRDYCRQLNFGMALSLGDGEVLVTSDWLGLYPVYYYQAGLTFIVTTIPALLSCLESFHPAVDIKGLVGIFLLAHSCLGRTLFQGVSRLRSGTLLKYGGPGRLTQEDVDMGPAALAPKNLDDAVDAFDDALAAVVKGATREQTQSIFLSGGLDSRIVAGYLHRLSSAERTAITIGDRKDLEVRAAARVASAIGARHELIGMGQSYYPEFAHRALDHDAISSGLYVFGEWALSKTPRPPMLTGFVGDPLMGASHVEWGKEPSCDLHTFHAMFTRVNAWGLSPGVIRELVRADDIDDIILDVWRQLRDEYYSYPGQPWQRSWWFDLLHRQRFIVGRCPKVLALGSWPVLPYVYPPILKLALATPLSLLSDRNLQKELILRRFPALARLSFARDVDRKLYKIVPHKTRLWTPVMDRVKDSLFWHVHNKLKFPERRYYVRAFDFNGAGWKSLRDEARARASDADPWLNRGLVLQLIPPSSTELQIKLAVSEPTGRRTLIGAVLGCSQYFA